MKFEWDERKKLINFAKNEVRFEDA